MFNGTQEELDDAMREFREKLDRRKRDELSGIPAPPQIESEVIFLEKRETTQTPPDETILLRGQS